MKQFLTTAALALSFALPMFAISTTASADPHYIVVRGTGPDADGRIEIRSRSHGEGKVTCVIPVEDYLNRNHEQNWSRWIHVEWQIIFGHRENSEWNYKDANGKWCPIWDRRGWIDKADPDLRVYKERVGHFPVPDTWSSTVHSTGIWGDNVPVFRDSGAFFNARKEVNANGNYNSQKRNVKCFLEPGTKVSFSRHKDWGVGQVWMLPNSPRELGNCSGWIDRGVIR